MFSFRFPERCTTKENHSDYNRNYRCRYNRSHFGHLFHHEKLISQWFDWQYNDYRFCFDKVISKPS